MNEYENIVTLTMDELIARINEMTALSRKRALTDDESETRTCLRAEYLRRFRESMKADLESIRIVDENGVERPLKKTETEGSNI